MSQKCKRDWEVDAVLDGRIHGTDADAFHAHRATCASCRHRYTEDLALRRLARMLPSPSTDEVTARRTRQDVMRAFATRQRPAKWRRPLFAFAASIIVLFVWTMRPKSSVMLPITTAPTNAVITPSASAHIEGVAARYEHTRVGDVERVTLTDGTISIHVPHREASERFIVTLPDGEIEVRGTTFSVTVDASVTRAVRVREGRVALRLVGAEEQLITGPGEWTRAPVAVASASPTQKHGTMPADDTAAAEYENAARLLRERDYEAAASAFHAFVSRHPTRAEAEDAAFLEATALSRAGRRDEAAARASAFLIHYPNSFHVHEATELSHITRDE